MMRTCFFFLFLSNIVYAQLNGKITGSVISQEGTPQADVVVSLVKGASMTLLKTTFTEPGGRFEFTELTADTFRVLIQQSGFQAYKGEPIVLTESTPDVSLPPVSLQQQTTQLEGVVVTGKVPFVERIIDRTIINPEALISNAGGSSLDVLSKAPGIMVDESGNIKLKGKSGVLVLIDNKPTYLTGDELASYLKSLPAEAVKQIEIMTNPPAQYEASGNAGVINIITKKSKLKGLNGTISANYSQGRYARTSNNLNLTYGTKKLVIFSTISGGVHNSFHDLTINRRYMDDAGNTESIFTQNTYIKPHTEYMNSKLGMDYSVSDKTTLGIVTKGVYSRSFITSFNQAEFQLPDQTVTSSVIADNSETMKFRNGSVNLNGRHQFDSLGRAITMDMDYVAYSNHIGQDQDNQIRAADGTTTLAYYQRGDLPSSIAIYAFKTDYTHPLRKGGRMDGGLKTSYTHTDNDAIYILTQNGVTENNYNLSNHFLYDEMINAAYINYSGSFGRFEMQSGLRFETTLLDGNQLGNPTKPQSSFNRNYTGLFPTLYLSYPLDTSGHNVLNINYGKRVNRPFYKDLNPFSSPLDVYTYYEGNPYLKPTFAHNVALTYSFKSLFSTTLSYSKSLNNIQETIEIREGIYYSRPGNIGTSEQVTLSAEASIPVAKWLTTTLYTESQYSHYRSQLYTETLNSEGVYWYINFNNSFTLGKGWSAEWSGEYLSDWIDSQFSFGDFGHMTVGFQKKVLKEQGTLRFSLNDVLWSNRIRGTINNLNNTTANWYGPRDTRVASFTFSLRFGKGTKARREHSEGGSDEEQQRVK